LDAVFGSPIMVQNFPAFTQYQEILLNGTIYIPPDTDGAVGPNHVMVSVNSDVTIFSKTGTQVAGWPKSASTFWNASAGFCFSKRIVLVGQTNGRPAGIGRNLPLGRGSETNA
jgi:hypothetical protein